MRRDNPVRAGAAIRPASRRGIGAAASFAATAAALVLFPATASAHPLGNFSVNHLTEASVSAQRVDVRYVLDQAEIPTFRERGVTDAEVLRRKRAEVLRGLAVRVDGRRVELVPTGRPKLTHPPGQGGLRTTRLELSLGAPARGARSVSVRDGTFPGRLGWKAVLVRPGAGTAVRTGAATTDPTNRLRRYPEDLLSSPRDVRVAELAVRPGAGTVASADGRIVGAAGKGAAGGGEDQSRGGEVAAAGAGESAAEDGFTGLLDGDGVLVLLLLAAFGWGAVHALSPGHGKAMVAAYLVGTRGTTRDALLLGATVTVTHTAGVVALGLVALGLSAWVLPEQLYPWLNLASGVLVVGVGVAVLRGRLRATGHHHHGRRHHHPHDHHHGAAHDRRHEGAAHDHRHEGAAHDHRHEGAAHDHRHEGAAHDRRHEGAAHDRRHEGAAHDHRHEGAAHDHRHEGAAHDHHHGGPRHEHDPGARHDHDHGAGRHGHRRSLLAMGASAGLIPCPSALVVLLGAVAQHRIGLGLVLIVAFSAGLAATLAGLGVAVVHTGKALRRLPVPGRLATAVPALSAALIVVVGVVLTAQALPEIAAH